MTLVITIVSHHGIWQSTDHRLTRGGRTSDDAAMKQVRIEATDGKAILAYAGLGQVRDTHISEWVRKLLRGAKRTIEHHLAVLTEAADRKLVPHSQRIGVPHTFSVGAFKDGHPMLYFVSNRVRKEGRETIGIKFAYKGFKLNDKPYALIVNVEGLGAAAMPENQIKDMIVKIVRRRADKPSCGQDVTAALAYLNKKASKDIRSEDTVSERCLVTYLGSPADGFESRYCGWDDDQEKPIFQDISGTHDITGIINAIAPTIMEHLARKMKRRRKGEPVEDELDVDVLNKILREHDFDPTDKL